MGVSLQKHAHGLPDARHELYFRAASLMRARIAPFVVPLPRPPVRRASCIIRSNASRSLLLFCASAGLRLGVLPDARARRAHPTTLATVAAAGGDGTGRAAADRRPAPDPGQVSSRHGVEQLEQDRVRLELRVELELGRLGIRDGEPFGSPASRLRPADDASAPTIGPCGPTPILRPADPDVLRRRRRQQQPDGQMREPWNDVPDSHRGVQLRRRERLPVGAGLLRHGHHGRAGVRRRARPAARRRATPDAGPGRRSARETRNARTA